MATTFSLTTRRRTEKGKGAARRLRAAARIPAVLYGKAVDPVLLELESREFLKTVSGHSVSNMILDLDTDGETVKALIREIQVDPVSNEVLHVDLNRVSMTEKIEVEVPIDLLGVPEGVKNFGGILAQSLRSVAVRVLAANVPEKIEVDISGLGLGESIHIGDLATGDLEIVSDPSGLVAAVNAPAAVEEPEAAEEATEGEGEAEGEKKEEETKEKE